MNNSLSDQGIPVLTEVISAESAEPPAIATRATPAPSAMEPDLPAAATAEKSFRTAAAPAAPPAAESPASAVPATAASASMPRPFSSPAAHIPAENPPPEQQAGSGLSDEEWSQLENDLRRRITRQVLGRIDFVLEHRVRSTLTDVVDTAIDGLAEEIKRGLHETLTDIVTRAVAQEVARIHPSKK